MTNAPVAHRRELDGPDEPGHDGERPLQGGG